MAAASPKCVMIIAGEASGDLHGARLVEAMRKKSPDLFFCGMGGDSLKRAGVRILVNASELSVVGITEAFAKSRSILRGRLVAKRLLKGLRPDLLILIDFPDFNLHIAATAKKIGTPVLYYVSPQIWAWRSGRIKKIKKRVDHMAVILPFEERYYRDHQIPATYVGHPLLDHDQASSLPMPAVADALPVNTPLGTADPGHTVIGLLPGSRDREVSRLLPLMLETAEYITQSQPDISFALSVAPTVNPLIFETMLSQHRKQAKIDLIPNGVNTIFQRSAIIVAASGTVTLEAAIAGKPTIITYKVSRTSYLLGKALIKVNFIGLANLIAGKEIVPELIQKEATPHVVAEKIINLLNHPEQLETIRRELLKVKELLGRPGASDRTADIALQLISTRSFSQLKSKNSPKAVAKSRSKQLFQLIKEYRYRFILAIVCGILVSAADSFTAYLVKPVMDGIFINKDVTRLTLIPLVIICVFVLKGAGMFGQEYLMNYVGEGVIRRLRNQLYSHISGLPLSFFQSERTGVLMSRITNDVNILKNMMSVSVTSIFRGVFSIVGLTGVIFYLDWKSALFAFVVLPLGFYPIVQFGRRVRRVSTGCQQAMAELTAFLHETFAGNKIVKAFGMEPHEINRFEQRTHKLFRLEIKAAVAKAYSSPVMEILGAMGVAAVIWYGGSKVINGTSTPGTFFAFMTAMMMLYGPAKKTAKLNNSVQAGMAATDRIFDVLETTARISDAPNAQSLANAPHQVTFENVSFRYEDDWVLNNINLKVTSGEILALVGMSGGGKTSLVNLIPRFYDVSEGAIKIDQLDIREVTLKSLRKQIAIVTQEPILFNDTVRNNIAYGNPQASDQDIVEAAKAAFAYDFIQGFPKQFETNIGELGSRLSGGEKQRICIARALLKNAPILILDEATSALDAEAEALVQKALENLMQGRTTFVIAHRLSTIGYANRIIVLVGGKIVEEGQQDQLLAKRGEYYKLHHMQFGANSDE